MPKPVEHPIKNLTDFTQRVEEALAFTRTRYGNDPPVVNWYRGHGKSVTYALKPGLYRHRLKKDANELLKLEREMLEWFKRQSILLQSYKFDPAHADANYEFLFFMQHYGVPTRLLDWTGNPYIALYFALTGASLNAAGVHDEDAAVWILSPHAWNEKALSDVSWGSRGALAFDHKEKNGYAPRQSDDPNDLKQMYEDPVAMHGIANNTRMFAQKGVFTIFGKNTKPMEVTYEDRGYPDGSLVKLIVKKADIDTLLSSVISIGFTDSVSYPDLHGLAMEIRRYFGFSL